MDPFKNAALKAGGNKSELIEFPNFYLIEVLEAAGSLNKLAEDIFDNTGKDFYYQVGWGNAASILNDLSMTGAKPLTLKLFIVAGNQKWFSDKSRWQRLIKGFSDAAKFSGATWNGGETQTLVNIINPKSIVLAGSATGIVQPKNKLFSDQKIKLGDRIILLSSSGVHTNGITLIRKIFKQNPPALIKAIYNKTVIYSPLINQLVTEGIDIHYASHITVHGWRKIMRPQRELTYVIDQVPKPQPIFKLIQQASGMTNKQIYGDYNMGIGFTLYAPERSVDPILSKAREFGLKALDAGYVEKGPRKVVIRPINIEFQGNSLQIR